MEARPGVPSAWLEVDAYDYELPEGLIAHEPAAERSGSRLLLCGATEVVPFGRILEVARAGDLVVFNDAKVVPCRLRARKETGGVAEVFVLSPREGWGASMAGVGAKVHAMVRSNKALKAGTVLLLDAPEGYAEARATLVERHEDGTWELWVSSVGGGVLLEWMEAAGRVPLPPYILGRRRALGEAEDRDEDRERYQTVYARRPGAVAAPTAGLHFQAETLEGLRAKGVELGFVTLHVGAGTFKPLAEGSLSGQSLHEELYEVTPTLARQAAEVRARGGRVLAVGTTCARALEDQGQRWGEARLEPGTYRTRLFIQPGFAWRWVDGLITNFHLPKSSLLVLVASLMGYEEMREAYRVAVARGLRFYSYGDAMFAWRKGLGER